jgi:iron-sulfur cluster repair protein YtfE (RIC family)
VAAGPTLAVSPLEHLDQDDRMPSLRASSALTPLTREGEAVSWTERSQAELIHHLLGRYHEPLREELLEQLRGLTGN